jgi:DNA mismatch repair protein MutH
MSGPVRRIVEPTSIDELVQRARELEGHTLAEIASRIGSATPGTGLHAKGKTGELLEQVLGATGGSAARVDFPSLGVELKSIPIDGRGRPRESTFVCAVRLEDAEHAEWETSWVREKLRRVLWIPVSDDDRRVGHAFVWQPSDEDDAILRGDFEDIMGLVGIGRIEDVSAHMGTYLQMRPKARDGEPRAFAFGSEGERVRTVRRGFYLRARFTSALLDRMLPSRPR